MSGQKNIQIKHFEYFLENVCSQNRITMWSLSAADSIVQGIGGLAVGNTKADAPIPEPALTFEFTTLLSRV